MSKKVIKSKKKQELKKRKKRKLLALFLIMSITLLLLIGGTYAWFIGLGVVKVNEFELIVTAGNQLELSLTGNTNDWHGKDDPITIDETTVDTEGYSNGTNHGVGLDGLKPVSTDGYMNETVSRLELYSKTTITSTDGGYKLLADYVPNTDYEQDGYFVFDLFIKNGQEETYIEDYNYEDDEDIYMIKQPSAAGAEQVNSAVGAPSGGGDDYGIANSLRVAFMQLGRIKAKDYSPVAAKNISCSTRDYDLDGDGEGEETQHITGLCNKGTVNDGFNIGKTWNIWEPNETKHHETIVDRFNGICMKRGVVGDNIDYLKDDETGNFIPCTPISDGQYIDTYCVNQPITTAFDPHVDIYDGLNGYVPGSGEEGTSTFGPDHGLTKIDTLTDSEVNTTDNTTRKQLFKLAPNSITKVRIYLYLEGQDVDNYDLIYNGEKIKVQFGLTRDRYEIEERVPIEDDD